MDPETKALLQENLDVSKENNMLLKKMARNQKWTNIYRVVYWSIIILSTFGAYYFIQPFISNLFGAYGLSSNDSQSKQSELLRNLSTKDQVEDFINSIK